MPGLLLCCCVTKGRTWIDTPPILPLSSNQSKRASSWSLSRPDSFLLCQIGGAHRKSCDSLRCMFPLNFAMPLMLLPIRIDDSTKGGLIIFWEFFYRDTLRTQTFKTLVSSIVIRRRLGPKLKLGAL